MVRLAAALFECDFEEDDICGMRRGAVVSLQKDFEWTRLSGQTPSATTGPWFAASGDYYVYIESSDPRTSGDVAL